MTPTERIFAFDVRPIIQEGIAAKWLNPYVRYQAYVRVEDLFDTEPGLCRCGCQQSLPTKRHKWATKDCNVFANSVLNILRGHRETVLFYLSQQHGAACVHCGVTDTDLQVDHIRAVMYGGGACWLDNYQLLCLDCHKTKTKNDFLK